MTEQVTILGDLIHTLKDGGAYAGWALFVLMWYYERRSNKKSSKDMIDIAVLKIRGDVKTENSLLSLIEAINSLGLKIEIITSDVKGFKHRLKSALIQPSERGE